MNKNMRKMYTEEEIINLIKANSDVAIVDSLVGKDVKVKTLEQSEPNYELEFSFEQSVSGLPTGIEITNIFSKCVQYGNILYIVGNFILENKTENSISITSFYKGLTILDANISNKIYDYGGKKVSEAQPDNTKMDITTDIGFTGISNIVSSQARNVYIRHVGVNTIQFEIGYGTTITAGGKNAFTFRTFLILE